MKFRLIIFAHSFPVLWLRSDTLSSVGAKVWTEELQKWVSLLLT